MEEPSYNWIDEEFPIRQYACINVDRPCLIKDCPAWYSKGDGWGRCLLVPGYIDPEEE